MASEENKKNRIMELSFKKFSTMGLPHVTMDEIARGAGIGKGTLYKYFPSKEALLYDTVEYISGRMERKIEEIMDDSQLSSMKKLSLILKTVGERLAKINPSAVAYLERALPEAYEKMVELRRRIILTNMIRLFEEGKLTGDFSKDMDCYLAAHILIGAANHIMDEKILSTLDYSLDNLFHAITSTILKGCLTEEGRKKAFDK